jgi:hypothetical protein
VDLIEFRRALRRHVRSSLVVAIVVLCFGLFATRGIQVKYEATSSVLVTPRAERFQGASASVLRVILPNVIVLARSDSLRAEAVSRVPAEYAATPVVIDAAFDQQASAMFITALSKDGPAAAAWSSAIARSLSERMKNDPYLIVHVLDPAEGATPTGRRVRILGVIESFGFAVAAFVLVAFGAQRFEESRDVAGALRRRGVRVLGSVIATRRGGARRDGLSVVLSALLHDGHDDGRLLVASLDDERLARWLADRVNEAERSNGNAEAVEPGVVNGTGRLDAIAVPLAREFSLWSMMRDFPSCILAVDDRVSSLAEILAGVELLGAAGIVFRGVVLVRATRSARLKSREGQLHS